LLASVEDSREKGVNAAWDLEIKERIRKYDAGVTKGIPAQEVFKELNKKLGR
jgi:Putative addiction module component